MRVLYNWTAKRAGGEITVHGFNADGTATKITGVDNIDCPAGEVIAIDWTGAKYLLFVLPR